MISKVQTNRWQNFSRKKNSFLHWLWLLNLPLNHIENLFPVTLQEKGLSYFCWVFFSLPVVKSKRWPKRGSEDNFKVLSGARERSYLAFAGGPFRNLSRSKMFILLCAKAGFWESGLFWIQFSMNIVLQLFQSAVKPIELAKAITCWHVTILFFILKAKNIKKCKSQRKLLKPRKWPWTLKFINWITWRGLAIASGIKEIM